MKALAINHVGIHALDLEASIAFYQDLLGMLPVQTPDFGHIRAQWMQLGDQQIHLTEMDVVVPHLHHTAFTVDDFEATYRKAKELGALTTNDGGAVRVFPPGVASFHAYDPARNRIEINGRGVEALDPSHFDSWTLLEDEFPQSEAAKRARLLP